MARQTPCAECGMTLYGPCSHPNCPRRREHTLIYQIHIPQSVLDMFSHLTSEEQVVAALTYQALTMSGLTGSEIQSVGRDVLRVADGLPKLEPQMLLSNWVKGTHKDGKTTWINMDNVETIEPREYGDGCPITMITTRSGEYEIFVEPVEHFLR